MGCESDSREGIYFYAPAETATLAAAARRHWAHDGRHDDNQTAEPLTRRRATGGCHPVAGRCRGAEGRCTIQAQQPEPMAPYSADSDYHPVAHFADGAFLADSSSRSRQGASTSVCTFCTAFALTERMADRAAGAGIGAVPVVSVS